MNFTSSFDVWSSGKKLSEVEASKFFIAQTKIEERTSDNQDSFTEQTTHWAIVPSQYHRDQKQFLKNRYSYKIKDTRIFLLSLQPRSPPKRT
jgi:hypothetical protein